MEKKTLVAYTYVDTIFDCWGFNNFRGFFTTCPDCLPTLLSKKPIMDNIWEKWKILSKKIGNFQLGIFFSILYYMIITPVGLISSLFNDYFRKKSFPTWGDWIDNSSSLKKLKEN